VAAQGRREAGEREAARVAKGLAACNRKYHRWYQQLRLGPARFTVADLQDRPGRSDPDRRLTLNGLDQLPQMTTNALFGRASRHRNADQWLIKYPRVLPGPVALEVDHNHPPENAHAMPASATPDRTDFRGLHRQLPATGRRNQKPGAAWRTNWRSASPMPYP